MVPSQLNWVAFRWALVLREMSEDVGQRGDALDAEDGCLAEGGLVHEGDALGSGHTAQGGAGRDVQIHDWGRERGRGRGEEGGTYCT